MSASTASYVCRILIVMLSAACGAGAQSDDPIVGLWEGRKVDGRYQTTEPWGPFRIERKADGSLGATYLGSRLGDRDLEMYDVGLDGDRFHLKMNRRYRIPPWTVSWSDLFRGSSYSFWLTARWSRFNTRSSDAA